MALFDKLSDFAKNIGDKTTDAIETGKLNSKVNSEKNLAGEELKKIGVFYYNFWLTGGEIAPELLDTFTAAKAHFDAAAEAQAEIDRIRAENEAAKAAAAAAAAAPVAPAAAEAAPDGPVCTACGAANNSGTKFCCSCGSKLEIPEPPAPRICPNCEATIAEGMKFCGECGTRTE